MWTIAVSGKKKLRIQKYPDTCGRGLKFHKQTKIKCKHFILKQGTVLQVKYSKAVGISAQKASRLFIFVGLASTLGRLVSGKLCNASRVNAVFIYQSSLLLASIATFLLPFVTKHWELILYSAVYGFSDGVFITTNGFIVLSCVDANRRTAAFSINNVLYAITAAAGGPIVGKFLTLFAL